MGRFDISPELAEEWRGNYRSWCDQEGLPWPTTWSGSCRS